MISKSERETKKIAADLVKKLPGPAVLALYGKLGGGKTTFVHGLAESLGIKERILSPTFVLLRSYFLDDPRFAKLHHFDLYRMENEEAAKTSGIEEILKENNSLVVIEWPEKIES